MLIGVTTCHGVDVTLLKRYSDSYVDRAKTQIYLCVTTPGVGRIQSKKGEFDYKLMSKKDMTTASMHAILQYSTIKQSYNV